MSRSCSFWIAQTISHLATTLKTNKNKKVFFLIKIKTSFDHKVKGPGKWSLSHHQRGASSVADKISDLGYFYSQHRVKKHSLPRQCLSILYTVRKSEPKQITAFSINPQIKAHFLAMAPQWLTVSLRRVIKMLIFKNGQLHIFFCKKENHCLQKLW